MLIKGILRKMGFGARLTSGTPFFVLTGICWIMLNVRPHMATATPHLGEGIGPVELIEIAVIDGDGIERPRLFELPEHVAEPLLVVYVPATRSAKRCVMTLVEPIRAAEERVVPIRLVTILDISNVNAFLGWIVRRVYRSERADNPDWRVEFLLDEMGTVRRAWGLPSTRCAYTLYHPSHQPLTGAGMPNALFRRSLLDRLKRLPFERENDDD
ncbi:MAG: hypothetical protein VX589_15375 [Myxococcota bacterium]|nr:hypothetical protein [Myxococcota bacterium]